MNKLWYATISLAIVAVVFGALFLFILPRNQPSSGAPIALIEDPQPDLFMAAEEDNLEEDFFSDYDLPPATQFESDSTQQSSEWLEENKHKILQEKDFPSFNPSVAADYTPAEIEKVPSTIKPPAPEPPAQMLPVRQTTTANNRRKLSSHTVASGEWFAQITNQYWGDFFLWPDLYTLNKMRNKDPDLIYPGELVNIYESLLDDDRLDPQERKILLAAYIRVYNTYKAIGASKNQSVWRLLYSATRYEPNFLELYQDQIEENDRKMAAKLVAEARSID